MFAAVSITNFPVAAFCRAAGVDGARMPVAVLEGMPPQEHVVACSRAAEAMRVVPGMSRVQAEAAGDVRLVDRDRSMEAVAYASAMEIAEQYSPRVEPVASHTNEYGGRESKNACLLLDRAGTGRLFGHAEEYARALAKALRQARLSANVATAPNAQAAMLLAESYAGVTCADERTTESMLAPLHISMLPCSPHVQGVFRRWGIRTLGELARLPERELVSRIGRQASALQSAARGRGDYLLQPAEPEFTLREETSFDTPLEQMDSLLFVLSPMIERLLLRAMERAYAVRSLELLLHLEGAGSHVLRLRPAAPTQSRDLLLKLLHLEMQAHPPGAAIRGLALEADPAAPQRAQRGLFQSQFPDPDRLDLLLARLRGIAGEENVGAPVLRNTHREDAFAIVLFRPHGSVETQECAVPSRLAIRQLRPPQPARVLLRNGIPDAMFWRNMRVCITSAMGPWHSSGGWWDGRMWDTDEWDAALGDPPQMVRLQQEHASRRWWVVGVYD